MDFVNLDWGGFIKA